jgi:hypothetical protein
VAESEKERSYKSEIIQRLFDKRWDSQARTLNNPIVTSAEIREEYIEYCGRHGEPVGTTNPPAFLKDLLRSRRRNDMWPAAVFAAGYTARQTTGDGRNFEFVPVPGGQTVPFPSVVPSPDIPPFQISSVTMPLAARRLGRSDEPSLIQVKM